MHIGPHKVHSHYLSEVVHIPEPTDDRVVPVLDASGIKGQPPKEGAPAVQVRGIGRVTEVIVDKVVYGATSHGEVQTAAHVVKRARNAVTVEWIVVVAEAHIASLRRLATQLLREVLRTGPGSEVYTISHGLETRRVPLVVHFVKKELHRTGVGNHEVGGAEQMVGMDKEPEWRVPEGNDHLPMIHIPPKVVEEDACHGGIEGIPASCAHADAGARGPRGGDTEQVFEGQNLTERPRPQPPKTGNTAEMAARPATQGLYRPNTSAAHYFAVLQA